MTAVPHIPTAWGQDPSAAFHDELFSAFKIKEGHGGKTWIVEGSCPYCAGAVKFEIEREGVASDTTDLIAQSESSDVLMIECTCADPHDGRPTGVRGCGQMWTLELEVS